MLRERDVSGLRCRLAPAEGPHDVDAHYAPGAVSQTASWPTVDGMFHLTVRLGGDATPLPQVPDDTSALAMGSVQGASFTQSLSG